ncbi:glycosyltransferase [Enterococcus sp. BWM-S5]|uniref:Glycosyltransferase n=1 Tax=Enterococcus larvae TaxID=2794352 RepID=A0ABS4CMW2_9ENTE|nr:glycosyltransferase [Enterococcus larvae]MBP1047795.1 glycosyltransferase [Enterococcus larvae]
MTQLFFCVLSLTGLLFFLRLRLAVLNIKSKRNIERKVIDEASYTIIQPILSGDPRLKQDLEKNLARTKTMRFIWLVDKSDAIAQAVTAEILEEPSYHERTICLLLEDVPEKINPKSFKLLQGIEKIQTEYAIILDDDSVIDFQRFDEMTSCEQRSDEFLVTGIPYNHGQTGFWSQLVASFVNSNSLLTYFPMAHVKETNTVNGMFYIVKTEILRKYHVFERIQEELCDDLAIADYLSERGVQLIQSSIPCNVRTTIKEPMQYLRLMKRWLLFATIYMKRHYSLRLFFLVVLPSILPIILLIWGLWLGVVPTLLVVGGLGAKAIILKSCRNRIFAIRENRSVILYEVLNDFLLPVLYLYTLVTPPVILWRNKKIRVSDGKIRYE